MDEGTDPNRRDVLAATEDDPNNFFTQQRRGFVASAAATVAAVFGLSGSAVAADDPHAAAARYESEQAATQALVEGTRELRQTLAERGVLDTPAATELTSLPFRSIPEYIDAEEGFVSYGTIHDGTPTAGISVSRRLDDADLKVVLYPDTGETYAVVTEDGAERGTIVRPGDASSDGVSTQDHTDGCLNCTISWICDRWYDGGQYWCLPKKVYNCDNCYVCHDNDHSCDSSCSDYC
ncbi:hypothetical protein BRC81_09530 [Halobacteriales archaeon QS_1_68_20]|nr:MAG: hypothetical protein BRC81_09530 [Halobacteriales archaeon QS_1_68_20]